MYVCFFFTLRTPRWCSGKATASGARGRAFDPRPGIPNTLKMVFISAALLDAQACGNSITTDWLVKRINRPVVLVTDPGNAVI